MTFFGGLWQWLEEECRKTIFGSVLQRANQQTWQQALALASSPIRAATTISQDLEMSCLNFGFTPTCKSL